MTGSPLREWVLFVMFWAILLAPVLYLTGSRAPAPEAVTMAAEETKGVRAFLTLRCSELPGSIRVLQGNQALWAVTSPSESILEHTASIRLQNQRVELVVDHDWVSGSSHARVIELTVEPDGLEGMSRHAWVDGAGRVVFRYEWPEEGP